MVISYHPDKVPSCPDCGDRGRRLGGDYFWCPSCHAQWEERDWDKRMAREKLYWDEAMKMEGVISCINIKDDVPCDNCGKNLEIYEKYCVNHAEMVNHIEFGHTVMHPKRYCKKCSIKAGYLKHVRNMHTGEETWVLFVMKDEEEI